MNQENINKILDRINSNQRFPLYLYCEEIPDSDELRFGLYFLLKESGIKKEIEWISKKDKLDTDSIQKTIVFFNSALESLHWAEAHS